MMGDRTTLLLVSADVPPVIGGIGRFTENLIHGLQRLGVKVVLVTSVGSVRVPAGIDVIRLPNWLNRKGLKLLPLAIATLLAARRFRPDALLAMTWAHEGICVWAATRLVRIPYITIAHGSDLLCHRRASALRQAVMRRIFTGARAVVANSAFTRSLLVQLGIDTEKITVVHPPVELPAAMGGEPADDVEARLDLAKKRVIFTAARLVERKGHADVIHVMARLQHRYRDLIYVMTGTGRYRDELCRMAAQYGVSDRIRMAGTVSDHELHQLYARAEIYVSPSGVTKNDVEGFGIALVEAALHAKPVIAGRAGGVSEAVVDGETGLLIDPSDTEALHDALVRLLDDPELRQQLGHAAMVRAAREFAPETRAEEFLRLVPVLSSAMSSR